MAAIDAQALGDLMDGDDGSIAAALHRAHESEVALQNATDVMRYANSVVADCLDLLDKRATTPHENREVALSKLLALAKVLKKSGVLS